MTRAYVAGRLVVAPLGPLGAELADATGRMLSLGTGVGVVERYLAEIDGDIRIEGVDLDPEKVALVAATADRSPRVALRVGDATTLADAGDFDVVLVCDLLHHVPPERQAALAAVVAAHLRPGGLCVVKDLDVTPHWKHEWNRLHDRLVAGPEPIHCLSPEGVADLFGAAGLDVERAERIDRRWEPYAHHIVVLRRPAEP